MTNRRKAWAVMVVVFVASVAVAANRFKPPPVLPTLMAELQVDMVTGGWLMSAFAVAAICLSIPAAFLLNWMGIKLTGSLALACVVLGAVIGGLAKGAPMLVMGGVIEGIGATLISVVAPVAISLWFPLEDRGLPMGIWAGWVPVGNVITFNLAHSLADAFGWRSLWWFGAGLASIALALVVLVVRAPAKKASRRSKAPSVADSLQHGLVNPRAWLLGLGFGAFGFALLGYNSWAPTFLTETMGVAPGTAGSLASLMFLAAIPANIIAGWFISRLRHPSRLLPLAFVLLCVLYIWAFRLESQAIIAPYMIALGLISNFIPATIFTLTPETASDPASASLALGLVNVGSNIGALAGPPTLGAIVSGGNWRMGSIGLVGVTVAGMIITWWVSRMLEDHDSSH